jgi:MYXO-CTERM domain-containing protein
MDGNGLDRMAPASSAGDPLSIHNTHAIVPPRSSYDGLVDVQALLCILARKESLMIARTLTACAVAATFTAAAGANLIWYFDDTGSAGWGQSYDPPDYWEWMDQNTLGPGTFQDLDYENPYFACAPPLLEGMIYPEYFEVHAWFDNNYIGTTEPVTVTFGYGQWGGPFTPVTSDTQYVSAWMGDDDPERLIFTFAPITFNLQADESLIVKISYEDEFGSPGTPGNTHLYWDSTETPSQLRVIPAPGALALLGLAALTPHRRRRRG